MERKVVFVMIDGLGDRSQPVGPFPEREARTPLQKAHVPQMHRLSRYGANGLMDPVEPGLACGSDTAHLSIFGYDPRKYYRGRGSFESLGSGLDMNVGDIAFKCNFATMEEESGMVTSRRADRNFEHLGPTLCEYLNGTEIPSFPDCRVEVKYATEHRCGVVVRGSNLCDNVTGTDPLRDQLKLKTSHPKKGFENDETAIRTSKLINELSNAFNDKLKLHPINIQRRKEGKSVANIVLLRGCGVRITVEPFYERHGMRAFMIAPTAIIRGIGISLDIDIKIVEGGTGNYHSNFDAKQEVFCKHITGDEYDFGFLHIKAIDDAGHDGNFDLKVNLLQRADAMLGKLLHTLRESYEQHKGQREYIIVVTGDHSTPVHFKDHSHDPVPFLICKMSHMVRDTLPGQSSEVDLVTQFSEIDVGQGRLGRFPGSQTLQIIKNY